MCRPGTHAIGTFRSWDDGHSAIALWLQGTERPVGGHLNRPTTLTPRYTRARAVEVLRARLLLLAISPVCRDETTRVGAACAPESSRLRDNLLGTPKSWVR